MNIEENEHKIKTNEHRKLFKTFFIFPLMQKRGQAMSLPFTLIFSLILIAVVIFVGFYVINMFLDRVEQVKLNVLPKDIEAKVIEIWQSSESEQEISFDCSKKVKYVCFVNFTKAKAGASTDKFAELKEFDNEANFFYYPLLNAEKYDSQSSWQVKCGDKDCLQPKTENPLCIECDGKISFTLTKESGQSYVMISR